MPALDEELTPARLDELLAFLPGFSEAGRAFILRWESGGAFPYPVYAADVTRFFALAGQPWWRDYGYQPAAAQDMLYDDAAVSAANPAEIRTMLTFAVRSERFADGSWGALLQDGRVQRLLRRLAELRAML